MAEQHPKLERRAAMEPAKDDRSLAALFTGFSRETSALIRQEAALVRAEVAEKINQAGSGIALLAAGGGLVLVSLFFLVQALVFGVVALLDIWLPAEIAVWLAPLLVGLLAALIGWVLLRGGLSRLRATSLAPTRTAASLRRDTNLVREHVR